MISEIALKFGHTQPPTATVIPSAPITVFVGPNNSGKSKVLGEIARYCQNGISDAAAVILQSMTFSASSEAQAEAEIKRISLAPLPGEALNLGHVIIGGRSGRNQLPWAPLKGYIQRPNENHGAFCQWFLTHKTLILDGPNRINLISAQSAGNLQLHPQSSFQVLFRDDAKRQEVRRIVNEAIGSYFCNRSN